MAGNRTSLRVATTNQGKLREFRDILIPLGITVRGMDDLPALQVVEDGLTFQDNALKKARAVAGVTGEPTIADDSGIEVDHLSGAPGVHSARYAGVDGAGQDAANRKRLLAALAGVPDAQRGARFVCVLAYLAANQPPKFFRGEVRGRIAHQERGSNGFGYDSIFLVPELGRTSAELASADKHRISHRGRALNELLAFLRNSP